jgi:NTE family protein
VIDLPDALVLGAGGTLGEAWLRGVLGGLEAGAGLDFRRCEYVLGTSAGSIVAATLAAGQRPEAGEAAARAWAEQAERGLAAGGGKAGTAGGGEAQDDEAGGEAAGTAGGEAAGPARAGAAAGRLGRVAAERAGGLARAVATPFTPLAMGATAPVGRLARAAALARAPRVERTLGELGAHLASLGATFDGQLRIFAVDRRTGRRVSFGAPDAPRATVAQAVLASCAVPWIFAPVEIGERTYVDGAVWSPVNLDAVPAGRGSRVLVLVPTAGAATAPLRTATTLALAREGSALRARGVQLDAIVPDDASLTAMGADLMDPSRREAVATAGYAQGRRAAATAAA